MARIKAFRAYRPREEYVRDMLILPYFTNTVQEDREIVKQKPYSFLKVERAETCLEMDVPYNDARVYEASKNNLEQMITEGILKKEEQDCLYLYQMETHDRIQTGIVSCVSIEDYRNGVVRRHELTKEEKEQDRVAHMRATQANTSPVFLIYQPKLEIKQLVNEWKKENDSLYHVETEDRVVHTVWKIDDASVIRKLEREFVEIDRLYIADGHHRIAASAKVKEELGSAFFLAGLFPADELKILEYDRVIHDLNGLSHSEFFRRLSRKFLIAECDEVTNPQDNYSFGMFYEKHWYHISLKQVYRTETTVVDQLNVSIFQKYILEEILDIHEIRKSTHVEYVGGVQHKKDLELRCGKNGIGFHLHPTRMEELLTVADQDQIMPPKSTWFEPKPRSGLFIYKTEK